MDIVQRDNIFNQTSPLRVDRNWFDLKHKVIGDWDMGILYPVSAQEVYPNDTFKISIQSKLIFDTMKFPIYQNLRASFYSFDVAYRNLWDHWRNYYTGGRKGNFNAMEPKVNLNCKSNIKGSLFDYLGFPLQEQLSGDVFVSAFPFIAYDFIYFWNFINPELQENIVYNIQDKLGNIDGRGNLYQVDELGLFAYLADTFYIDNEDGIPLYTRMLRPVRADLDYIEVKDNTSVYGYNDRYSYLPVNGQIGLVVNDGGIKGLSYGKKADDTKVTIKNSDYRNLVNIGFLYNINWQRDYFTSAHLSQQQGSPTSLPLVTNISASDITINQGSVDLGLKKLGNEEFRTNSKVHVGTAVPSSTNEYYLNPYTGPVSSDVSGDFLATSPFDITIPGSSLSSALTSTTSSFTANDFRLFWQINMIKENVLFNKKNFEYASYLKFFFGKGPNTSDLQQPVYIDSFDLDIYVGEILQTSQTTDNSSLGERGGIASSVDRDYMDTYTFDEVGLHMLVMFIAPKEVYQTSQGVNRMWLRNDRFDYYNPLLSRIGLQEIQNQEIYAQGNDEDKEPFGYTPAFNELRYIPDTVVGSMRDSLNAWHLSRIYDELPVLNSSYLLCRPSKRIFNVQDVDTPNITGLINVIIEACRDMPELALPELLDHRY